MVTFCRLVHSPNASDLMSVTLAGIVISRRDVQFANIRMGRVVNPSEMVTFSSFVHPANQLIMPLSTVIDPLMDTLRRFVHVPNTKDFIVVTLAGMETDSKAHLTNASLSISSRPLGREISFRLEQE